MEIEPRFGLLYNWTLLCPKDQDPRVSIGMIMKTYVLGAVDIIISKTNFNLKW